MACHRSACGASLQVEALEPASGRLTRMFQPPRCPNAACEFHRKPVTLFFIRRGYYKPNCRAHRVPRFRCKGCRRGFSRQTFRADYRDQKPHLNAPLFFSIASGVGLRQTARKIGMSQRCCELKFRKIAKHLRHLNRNVRAPLPEGSKLQFDELETYETRRNTRPLSVPILIERDSRFIIWSQAATIRPRGKMSEARKAALLADERRFGYRKDKSRQAIRRTFEYGAKLVAHHDKVFLQTDEKSTYPGLAEEAFGKDRLEHQTTNSKLARMTWNPLFPINHTEAMLRDLTGRIRRESWLVSKKRKYLNLGLQLIAAYRNFVRRRFNHDQESPAQLLSIAPRRLRPTEVLSWRQDWGPERSIRPWERAAA